MVTIPVIMTIFLSVFMLQFMKDAQNASSTRDFIFYLIYCLGCGFSLAGTWVIY